MTYEEAKNEFGAKILDKKILDKAIEQCEADACCGCAFITTEEWEMPCCKCMRSCKDYWRRAGEQDG